MAQAAMMSLGKALSLYTFPKPILAKTQSKDWAEGISLLKVHVAMYDAMAEEIVAELKDKALENAKKISEFNRMRLVRSALDPLFSSKYETVLKLQKDSTAMIQFLANFCTSETEDEQQEKAEIALSSLSRMIDENEPFRNFLFRIDALANTASKKADVRLHLKTKAFRRNLNQDLIQFLRESGKLNKNIDDQASYLDSMMKHIKPVGINAIGDHQQLVSEMQLMFKQNQQNTELLFQLTKEMESLRRNESNDSQESAQLYAIKDQRPSNRHGFSRPKPAQGKASSLSATSQQNQADKQWILNKAGRPIRCGKCGEYGHYKAICPGTCTATCHVCGQVGHLQAACPEKRRTKN